MTPERWEQIDKLLELALEQEPGRRSAFLDEACQGDAALRQEVESLLSAHGNAADFIEAGPARATAGETSVAAAQSLTGRQLGHYQILSPLGEGGMGIVYKARDTHLDRFVAIKVLPPELVADPDRKRRFVQEAKAASALNHPNIITIHDVASENGRDFIVMEYVHGKTLDRLIPRKGMRLNEAFKIAIPMADALAAAHGAGIVHRDIKPANVMVGETGQVKVLDFGLAKLIGPQRSDPAAAETKWRQSKTLETERGVILGTASYISPEQAEGKLVDHRSDIFSFGAVLYEMLTGRRAFQGDSTLAILTAVLREEPKPVCQVVEGLPRELEHIVQRCLRKDPERRWQSIADVKVTLWEIQEAASSDKGTQTVLHPHRTKRWPIWAGGLVGCLGALALTLWLWKSSRSSDGPLTAIPLTAYPGYERSPSLSPDGDQVVFSWDGEQRNNSDIYVKLIGTEDQPLRLTKDPAADSDPAWSPDGRWIAFLRDLADGKSAVLLVPPIGGSERKVGEIHKPWFAFGSPLAWSPDGASLVVVDRESDAEPYALFVLSLEAREKRKLTSPTAMTRGDGGPAFSPDGRMMAFVRTVDFGSADLYLLPVGKGVTAAGELQRLTSGQWQVNNPVWAPGGHEVIFSAGFVGFGIFEVSNLWRVLATGSDEPQQLAVGEHGFDLCISQKKRRLVYSRVVSDVDIWSVEISGSQAKPTTPARFMSSTRDETNPQISPDGNRVVFSSNRSGSNEIWICDHDGSNLVLLTSFGRGQTASPRWSPDGRSVSFDSNIEGQWEVYVVEIGGGRPRRLTSHPGLDAVPSWSRDGKWIYFGSNRSGSYQVWKMPASGGEASQVTQKGGWLPLESPDGQFVYYTKGYDDRRIWKVPSQGGEEAQVLGPIFRRDYDVAKDGIYFIPAPDRSEKDFSIRFLSFATGEIRTVASIENAWGNFISVSPDGRWILYPKMESEGSDLMLVENFR